MPSDADRDHHPGVHDQPETTFRIKRKPCSRSTGISVHDGPEYAVTTTKRDKEARSAPDLVDRDFKATAPNQLWVADVTFIPITAGFLYLAVVLDAWSRTIVGWSMANHLRAELVVGVGFERHRASQARQLLLPYAGPLTPPIAKSLQQRRL